MGHHVSSYEGVLTVRLDGRVDTQAFLQDLRDCLDSQTSAQTVILDTTLSGGFDQFLKSMLFRAFQHHSVGIIGICGVNEEVKQDVEDLVTVIGRVRKVIVRETEADLRVELGLVAPMANNRKFGGMLAYLKKS